MYITWKFVLRSLHTLFSSLWETQNRSPEKLYVSGEEDEPIKSFALQWRASDWKQGHFGFYIFAYKKS